jgi:hypothetical protein
MAAGPRGALAGVAPEGGELTAVMLAGVALVVDGEPEAFIPPIIGF